MICIKERYFKYHRIVLIIAGLWPYQQSKLVQFQLVLFLGILTSFIIFQVFQYLSIQIFNINHVLWFFASLIWDCKWKQYFNALNSFDIFFLQLSRVLFIEHTFDFTIKMLSVITFCIFFLINHLSFWVNMETVSWYSVHCKNILNNYNIFSYIIIYSAVLHYDDIRHNISLLH